MSSFNWNLNEAFRELQKFYRHIINLKIFTYIVSKPAFDETGRKVFLYLVREIISYILHKIHKFRLKSVWHEVFNLDFCSLESYFSYLPCYSQ